MSSEGSVMSGGSRLRELGLYRTIDARTEEFLRLSKRRQLRQGCACAALSAAVTVTLVVVTILIYEHIIAVEWTTIQNPKTEDIKYMASEHPMADRLDQSYFGFDQDYYERMPLLVNALQENSYIDPAVEFIPASKTANQIHGNVRPPTSTVGNYRQNAFRRTSPRPFLFEYRTSTPLPYSKTYGSRSWVEKYRNAQRLQNIRQIIKYLEKTINAKSGDVYSYTKPGGAPVAFTGVYMEHSLDNQNSHRSKDLITQDSTMVEIKKSNHQPDPLFNFKPENPGEVNLLADAFFRFSPWQFQKSVETSNKTPIVRKSFNSKRYYNTKIQNQNTTRGDNASSTAADSFSVILNLFPLSAKTKGEVRAEDATAKQLSNLDTLYITTSRPIFQFKRKPTISVPRTFVRRKPRVLYKHKDIYSTNKIASMQSRDANKTQLVADVDPSISIGTNIILHVNVHPKDTQMKNTLLKDFNIDPATQDMTQPTPTTTAVPTTITLSTHQVNDFHIGSSGIVPEAERRATTLPGPKVTELNIMPSLDTSETQRDQSTVTPWTGPTEVLRFSHEDAKVPEQYGIQLQKYKIEEAAAANTRKAFRGQSQPPDEEKEIIIIKLKNENITKVTTDPSTTDVGESTPRWTYVPLLNGHYRSTKQSASGPSLRTRSRDDQSIRQRPPGYVPVYVEINRNKTTAIHTISNDDE
ncbi:uncharacterized protein LOC114245612 isoform X1 [Bombyx mandarina]|uniref:Uncharacterized protein LOC114245612 isoform X1 n=1 Tax=Bombyx mandarina TaxID=7092 RepID=A0A6J2JVS0_BOMMA|nr:uncharacterized protein LOC114245612 isoform X1 [Bombyx mandarina]